MPKKKEEQKETDIVEGLFKELKSYQQTNQTQRDDILDIYNAYIGNMDIVKKVPYFEPITIPKLRTEVSYIVPYIFSGQPEIEVEGIGMEDEQISSLLQRIVNFRLETIPQAYEKIEAWAKQSVAFGTSLIKINWSFKTEETEEGVETPTYDGPELDVPNILDCYYNPILPDVYCQNSLIFRSVLPIEEVKNNPAYNYKGEKGLNREFVKSKNNRNERENSSRMGDSEGLDAKTISEGTIEIYERLTPTGITTIANGEEQLLLRDVKTNKKRIDAVKLIHEPNCIPNRFDGFGVGQNTLGLSKGYHSIVNQTKQNVTLANNPMFYGRKGANIRKQDLVAKPGGFIEVDGEGPLSNDFAQVDFQDIKQGALEFISLLDDEHKRASGANDIIQGGSSNKTLGQDELSTTNSANRFELIQRRFKQSLAEVAEILIKLELENLQSPDADILRIFPDEMPQVDPMTGQEIMVPGLRQQIYQILISEAKNTRFNIKVKGETTIAKNKDVQIKQLIDWYEMFADTLPPKNKMEVSRKILELRGIDDIDSIVPSAEEMEQQQMMQMGQPTSPTGEPTQRGINQATYAQ